MVLWKWWFYNFIFCIVNTSIHFFGEYFSFEKLVYYSWSKVSRRKLLFNHSIVTKYFFYWLSNLYKATLYSLDSEVEIEGLSMFSEITYTRHLTQDTRHKTQDTRHKTQIYTLYFIFYILYLISYIQILIEF